MDFLDALSEPGDGRASKSARSGRATPKPVPSGRPPAWLATNGRQARRNCRGPRPVRHSIPRARCRQSSFQPETGECGMPGIDRAVWSPALAVISGRSCRSGSAAAPGVGQTPPAPSARAGGSEPDGSAPQRCLARFQPEHVRHQACRTRQILPVVTTRLRTAGAAESRLNLPQLDTKAANLDLAIAPADEFQRPVWRVADQVPGTEEPAAAPGPLAEPGPG